MKDSFVHNGIFQYEGSQVGHWVSLKQPVQFVQGLNKLTLLSEIVGLQVFRNFMMPFLAK